MGGGGHTGPRLIICPLAASMRGRQVDMASPQGSATMALPWPWGDTLLSHPVPDES